VGAIELNSRRDPETSSQGSPRLGAAEGSGSASRRSPRAGRDRRLRAAESRTATAPAGCARPGGPRAGSATEAGPPGGDGGDGDDPKKPFQFPKPHYQTKLTFKRRLRKSTQKKSTAQILSSISTSTSSMRTRKRVEREQLEEEFEERGVLYIQPIPPIVDRNGRIVWNGHRNHISWYPGFLDAWWLANGPKNHTQCAYYGEGGCSGDMHIDHIRSAVDYILNVAGVEPEEVCDGIHHWTAYILDDANTINSQHPLHPSPNDTIRTAYHHENNLQGMCAHHNESKGSNRRGLDDPSPPVYVGPCTCGVGLLSASKKIRRNKNQDL
jgi:hypothetical protein